ncbi:GDP-mannose transporter [Nadsonia fulvescens var. elongata DSM 6958]|uniref:GDP-mannose transporter n=1 Tax=Nadsonia fulvescens var. elongata DSM 6958 TaxID=857566 RepID=A0A1E3PMT7_9ASCO|nr:GDP-mannose transporter [Nadsonia fulvescens var. elongata DSM 6958]
MSYNDKKQDDTGVSLGETAASPRSAPPPVTNSPVVSIFSYCGASILMTVTNKYVLSGNSFNMNCLLLAVQSIVCLMAISICKSFGIINYRQFNADEAKKWFPISALLVIMIYTSSKALQFLSIPVYTIFKNLTIILIAYGEVIWFGGAVTPMALVSFLIMVLSSVVAAWADISSALSTSATTSLSNASAVSSLNAGYIWMFTNCFSSAAYVLIMRKRIKLTNFKDFDTMYYNNLLSIPVLIVASLLMEDWSAANLQLNFPPETRNYTIISMIVSGLTSVGISYTSAWCVRVTSSTTYSMVGALNKLPVALSGLIFFDAPVTFFSVTAIFLGFLAGLVYAVAKINQKKAETSLPTSSK